MLPTPVFLGFSCGSVGKESAFNAENRGLIPGSGRFPGEGNSNPLQCSCLENSKDRGVGQAAVHRIAESQIQPTATKFHFHLQFTLLSCKDSEFLRADFFLCISSYRGVRFWCTKNILASGNTQKMLISVTFLNVTGAFSSSRLLTVSSKTLQQV